MTEPTRLETVPHVEWGVFVVEGDRLRRPGLVGPADELVLLAAVRPAPAWVAAELYRGDVLRDRCEVRPAPDATEAALALRLGRGAALAGSTRLRCRLLVNGRRIGEHTVLLGAPAIDAQGRLTEGPAALASDATQLALTRALEESWRQRAD
jgi:hypothetical protein